MTNPHAKWMVAGRRVIEVSTGMRERAEKPGARLVIWRRPQEETEIYIELD